MPDPCKPFWWCTKCDAWGHNATHCPQNRFRSDMPLGGFRKARPPPHARALCSSANRTRTCLPWPSHPRNRVGLAAPPPLASPIVADALLVTHPRNHVGLVALPPLAPSIGADSPIVLAMDMFGRTDGTATAYVDSGAQLTVVRDAACLEDVTVAPAGHHLKGAVEGSEMPITHHG